MPSPLDAYEPPDHLAEAVSAARAAMRAKPWDSLRYAVISAVSGPALVAGVLFGLKEAGRIDTAFVSGGIWIAAVICGPTVYVAFEIKRLLDRSVALSDLLLALKQYDALIRDARDERNQLRQLVATVEGKLTAHEVLLGLTSFTKPGDGDHRK